MRASTVAVALGAAAVLGAGAVLPAVPASAAETIKISYVTGYAPSFPWPRAFIEVFVPEVDKRLAADGKYKIDWNLGHSGTVVKPRGEIEAVQSGLAEMGAVVTAFHVDRVPLYNLPFVTPFSTSDLHLLQDIYAKLKVTYQADFQKDWDAVTQVPVALTGPLANYWVLSRKPLTSYTDLKGIKLSAAGPNLIWGTSVGAAGITSAATDWYMQLNTGLADAVLSWADVTGSQKLCEPAKHVLDADIGGVIAHEVTVNKDVWAKLPSAVKDAFLAAAPIYMKAQADFVVEGNKKQMAFCTGEMGMKVVKVSAEDRKAWAKALPPVALNWAKDMDAKGKPGSKMLTSYMDALRAAGSAPARDWDKE
ncbi:MAG: TRAP transporter substrate-binding protein DctP [Alphaproteobacteria bacterium]